MKEIIKLAMKHPFISLLLSIALVIPYFFAFVIFNWHGIKDLGAISILISSIVFSFIPICIWGIISLMTVKILNKPIIKENTVEYNEYLNGWKHNILMACTATIILSVVFLPISWFFSLGFKWFVILTYLFPFLRLIITSIQLIKSKQ